MEQRLDHGSIYRLGHWHQNWNDAAEHSESGHRPHPGIHLRMVVDSADVGLHPVDYSVGIPSNLSSYWIR